MASIAKVVKITVSLLTAGVKEAGFGIPLIADYHTRFSERIRFYENLDGMVTDGFAVTDAAYKAAAQVFAQSPAVPELAIGRRLLQPVISIKLTIAAISSKKYAVKVTSPNGTVATTTTTSDSSATVAEIVAAMVTDIGALSGITATDTGGAHTSVTVTATAGGFFALEVVEDGVSAGHAGINCEVLSADPGIATDLADLQLVDGSWYGLTLTTNSLAENEAASAWAESNKKQFLQATQDGTVLDNTAGNCMKLANTAGRAYTGYIYHQNPTQFAGAAWLGSVYPIDPGAVTFAFRRLANVDKSLLTSTQMTNIEGVKGNYFVDIGGNGITLPGTAASGEWLDIVRDTDWYEVQIGVEHLLVKLNNNKVPMTNAGIAMEEKALRAATDRACKAGFLDPTSVVYTVPDVLDIPTNKRAARILSKLTVTARVQGAIHLTEITANITE